MGASGAISGVLGFYFLWFPRNTVRMLAFLPPFLMQVFEIPAKFVLGMYLLFDNLLPFLFAGEGGVAHGAHIGGFIAGGLAAWLMDHRGAAARPADIEAPEAAPGAAALRAALADGRYDDAARAYFALPAPAARGVLSAEEAVELASWLREQGHADAALVLLRRVVRDVPRARASPRPTPSPDDPARRPPRADRRVPVPAHRPRDGPRPETAATVRQELAAIEALQKRRVGRLRLGRARWPGLP